MTAAGLRSRTTRIGRLFAFVALSLVGITCRDSSVTGPGLPTRAQLAIAPRFEVVEGGPTIVLHAARAELFRMPGGAPAGSATGFFNADGSDLELSLAVTLTEAEETFILRIAATDVNGDTVFRSLDSSVVIRRGGLPTEATPVVLTYAGEDALAVSLAISPTDTLMDVGTSATFSVIARKSDSTVVEAPVGWVSSDPTKLSVTSEGVATAHSEFTGVLLIATTATGLADTAHVSAMRAVGSVVVSPPTSQVIIGRTTQLTAAVHASDNSPLPGRPVEWTSSDPLIATVSQTGLVTGVATGTVTITAKSGGVAATASVTVIVAPVATVVVAPADTSVLVGATFTMRPTLRDDLGNVITGRIITWASLDPSSATVNLTTGVVTAVGEGDARIVATSEGKIGQALVHVQRQATTLSVSAGPATFGGTVILSSRLFLGTTGIAGKTITFFLGGAQVGTAVTDAQGIATLTVSVAGIPVGSYPATATPPGVTAQFAGDAAYGPSSATNALTITKAQATLTLGNLNHVFDGTPKSATVTTSPAGLSGVTVTYQSAGGTPTTTPPTNVGSYTVTATLTHSDYTASPVTGTLVISQAQQTITFSALPSKTYGDAPFAIAATSSSGLPVTFTSTGACSVAGNTVTITATGSCTITAAQSGSTNYSAAVPVSQTFTINPGTATLTLGNLSHTYDGTPKAVLVTTSPAGLSGVTVTYSGSATPPVNAGSYSVVATLSNPNYSAAPATGTLVISPATATLTFGTSSVVYNGTQQSIAVSTSPAGLASVSITYDGTNNPPTDAGTYAVVATLTNPNYTAAPLSGSFTITRAPATLTLSNLSQVYDGAPKFVTVTTTPSSALGTVTVTYDGSETAPRDAGSYAVVATLNNPNYQATPATGTLVIGAASQTINWPDITGATYRVGDGPFTLNATASSGLPVTFNATGVCSVSGNTLTINAAGTCTINALQNGNASYQAAPPVTQTITVLQGNATLNVSDLNQNYDGSPKPITVTTTPAGLSGVSVMYAGNTVSYPQSATPPTNPGTYDVVVQLSNPNYVASQVNTQLVINRASQTITVDPIPTRTYGDPNPIDVSARSTSGLPVSYDVTDGPCYIDGGLHMYAVGTCTLVATQEGDAFYLPADPVTFYITMEKAVATIVIENESVAYSGEPQNPTYSTNPQGLESSVVFTYDQGFTPVEQGSYGYTATLEDPNYTAEPVKGTLVIYGLIKEKASQYITFPAFEPRSIGLGDPVPQPQAYASSYPSLPIKYTTSGPCSYDTELVVDGVGDCIVTANQEGNEQWYAAEPVSQTLTITEKGGDGRTPQTIDFPELDPDTIVYGDPLPDLKATASSGLWVSYSASGACNNNDGILIEGPGTCFITASQEGDGEWAPAPSVTRELVVLDPNSKQPQTLTVEPIANRTYEDGSVQVSASSSSGNWYVSDASGACSSIGDNYIEMQSPNVGTCTITVYAPADKTYDEATEVVEFEVGYPAPSWIQVTPDNATLVAGTTQQLVATYRDQSSNQVPGSGAITWRSDDPGYASVVDGGSGTATVTAVAEGATTIVASGDGVNGYSSIYVVRPQMAVKTWTGNALDRQWQNGANWSPSGAPTVNDSAVVPATTYNPMLTNTATVGALILQSGSQLDIGAYSLVVDRNLIAGNTIVGAGEVQMQGTGTVEGTVPHLRISGATTMTGKVTVNGRLRIDTTGVFTMNGHVATVTDSLVAVGRLRMWSAADTLVVGRNARFATGVSGDLSGGVLILNEALIASSTTSPQFRASGTHEVIMAGNCTGRCGMEVTNTQKIQNLKVTRSTGLTFNDTDVLGTFKVEGAVGSLIFNGLNRFPGTVASIGAPMVINSGASVDISGGGFTTLSGGKISGAGTLVVDGPFVGGDDVTIALIALSDPTGTMNVDSRFTPAKVRFNSGSNMQVKGLAYNTLEVSSGSAVAMGAFTAQVLATSNAGNLRLGGYQHVVDSLSVASLTMDLPQDQLTVNRGAYFSNKGTFFTDGVLIVKGSFRTQTSLGTDHFQASGNHKVILSGTSLQTVVMSSTSYFNNLEISNSVGGVTFNSSSAVNVNGDMNLLAGAKAAISGTTTVRVCSDSPFGRLTLGAGSTFTFVSPAVLKARLTSNQGGTISSSPVPCP